MAVSPQLTTRVTNILKQPAQEWAVIAAEPADVASLMGGYAAPLAAVTAICRLIGMSVIGISLPFMGTYRVGIVRGVVGAIGSWVFALVGAYIGAIGIEKLAPTFKWSGSTAQPLHLFVYSSTPACAAAVLNLT